MAKQLNWPVKVAVVPAVLAAGIALTQFSIPTAHALPQCPDGYAFGYHDKCWPTPYGGHQPSADQMIQCARATGGSEDCAGSVPTIGPDTSTASVPSRVPASSVAPSNPSGQAPTTKPAVVRPPKGLNAPNSAIAAAKANPLPANPSNPPSPPTQKDFSARVQAAVKSHSGNLDVDNGTVRPCHWDYVDNDANGHPVIYNPMSEGMTFRYYYQGSYQEAYVAAGTSVSFDFSDYTGVFPFTAVGDTYLTSGTFYAGTPPPTYQNVNVYLPAYGRTVQVDQVQPVGHDDSQPAGSQDSFMLNGTTFAKGQTTNPGDGGSITVAETQSLPNVGPTDNGGSLIDLTAAGQPQSNKTPWLIGGLVALVVLVCGGAWIWQRRRERRA
jgi:hypothetical protein